MFKSIQSRVKSTIYISDLFKTFGSEALIPYFKTHLSHILQVDVQWKFNC